MEAIYIKGPDGEPEYDGMHMDGYELELWEARQERGRMEAELADLSLMGEEEACILYNVDSKAEAEQLIKEYYI